MLGMGWIDSEKLKELTDNNADLDTVEIEGKPLSPSLIIYPHHVSLLVRADHVQKLRRFTPGDLVKVIKDYLQGETYEKAEQQLFYPVKKEKKQKKKQEKEEPKKITKITNDINERVNVECKTKKNQRRTCKVRYSMDTQDQVLRAMRIQLQNMGYDADTMSELPQEHESDMRFCGLYIFIKEQIRHSTNPKTLPKPRSQF